MRCFGLTVVTALACAGVKLAGGLTSLVRDIAEQGQSQASGGVGGDERAGPHRLGRRGGAIQGRLRVLQEKVRDATVSSTPAPTPARALRRFGCAPG